MEMAQFGDTEMESTEIKSVSRRLCGSPSPLSPKGGSSSVSSNSSSEGTGELAQEFAKLANIVDDRKALSVGKSKKQLVYQRSVPVRNFVYVLSILALWGEL